MASLPALAPANMPPHHFGDGDEDTSASVAVKIGSQVFGDDED
jgi:hypothetical protein